MSHTFADVQAMVDRVDAIDPPVISPRPFNPEFNAWVFSTAGGEVRNFLRIAEDRLVFTEAYRSNDDKKLVFSTPLLIDMEKFLTFKLCDGLRWNRRLPMLLVVSIPATNDKVAPEFNITKASGVGYELHRTGASVVRCGDELQLVEFSHYVSLSLEDIRESALDPEGKPHFMVME